MQVLVCQLLMDGMKAYNCLLPLVTTLPSQGPYFPASKFVASLGYAFGVCHGGMLVGYALKGML